MHSKLNANRTGKRRFSLKWWHFFIIIAIPAAVLYYLLPQSNILSYLNDSKPNAVSLVYLRNMAEKNPKDPTYRILLANQELSIGNIEIAENLIKPYYTAKPANKNQWQAMLVEYSIIRTKAYALKNKDPNRIQLEERLRQLNIELSHSPYLNTDEILLLANDAISLDLVDAGVNMYLRLAKLPSSIPASNFAKAGKYALYTSNYKASAELYFTAQDRTSSLDMKREYFINAIKSLHEGNLDNEALEAAKKHIGNLDHDKATLEYMANIAIAADRPDIALQYVNHMLGWSN